MKSSNPFDTILVVDDDPIALLLTHTVLTDVFTPNIVEAINDVEKACEFLSTCTPDLITIDMVMPKMNGLEFIAKICDNFKIDLSTILVISVYLRPSEIEVLNDMGIKYVLKPLTTEKLLSFLAFHLQIKQR